jgi:hypothetical protein
MFPIRDHNPSQGNARPDYLLIAVHVLIILAGGVSSRAIQALFIPLDALCLGPGEISAGQDLSTLVTSPSSTG